MTTTPQNPLIPSQAYLYFPQASDMKTQQGDRLIFDGNTKFDDQEHSKIVSFKAYADSRHYSLSSIWTDSMILRFLYASAFKKDKTLQTIKEHTLWRQKSLPVHVDEQLQQYLNSGILYMHGRDDKFRPIVVFNLNLIDPKKFDYGLITKYLTFWFEFIIHQCMLPGQVESWIFIVNLKDMKVSASAASSLKMIFSYLQENYKCRLHSLYMINAASSVYMPWKIIQKFLDEVILSKINFYKTSSPTSLLSHTNPEQVEQRFGGSAPNLTQYWPIQVRSENFFMSKEDEKMLVSAEKYTSLFKQGLLTGMVMNEALITLDIADGDMCGEATAKSALSTNRSGSSMTPKCKDHIQAEKAAEEEDDGSKMDITFVSFSNYFEEANSETDYAEYMDECAADSHFSSRASFVRTSFISDLIMKQDKITCQTS